jgi:hypothetical protein
MADQTFRALLAATTSETVERPRALAAGHYLGEIKSHEFGLSSQKKTPFVRFILVPESETNDVTASANDGIDFAKKELRKDFYITPTALYRLTDMLDAVLGPQMGRACDERIPETRGVKVMFAVTTRDNEDGTETYNDVGNVVAAPETQSQSIAA